MNTDRHTALLSTVAARLISDVEIELDADGFYLRTPAGNLIALGTDPKTATAALFEIAGC